MSKSPRFRPAVATLMFSVAVGACGISPKPEPPDAVPQVDTSFVTVTPARDYGDPAGVEGGPGAVDPADGFVRVWNLEAPTAPIDAPVAADGSFAAHFDINVGDEVRLQVVQGDQRSLPVDLVVGSANEPAKLAPHALGDCLVLSPSLEVVFPAHSVVVARNDCGGDVTFEQPTFRRAVTGLDAGQGITWPATLATGSSLSLTVSAQAGSGNFEEILFLRAVAPEVDRRPLTIRGSAP